MGKCNCGECGLSWHLCEPDFDQNRDPGDETEHVPEPPPVYEDETTPTEYTPGL